MKKKNKLFNFFDKVEDKIRARLSRVPIFYAFVGSIGIVLIWRGIWMIADDIEMSGLVSLFLGVMITITTGLFVSFFIGDKIIISGIKEEKRIDEKTIEEIKKEETTLLKIEQNLDDLKENLREISMNINTKE